MTKSTQYSIHILGQLSVWIWADEIETGERYSGHLGSPDDLWFRLGGVTVGSVKGQPGVEVKTLGDDMEWTTITPDSVRAANQKESSGTAQPAAE